MVTPPASDAVEARPVVHVWWPGFVGLTRCGVTAYEGVVALDWSDALAFRGIDDLCPECASAAAGARRARRRG